MCTSCSLVYACLQWDSYETKYRKRSSVEMGYATEMMTLKCHRNIQQSVLAIPGVQTKREPDFHKFHQTLLPLIKSRYCKPAIYKNILKRAHVSNASQTLLNPTHRISPKYVKTWDLTVISLPKAWVTISKGCIVSHLRTTDVSTKFYKDRRKKRI